MQQPFFAALGLDLTPYFAGTLNVDIAPRTFQLVQPAHTFRQVRWTDLHPPEDFSFSVCRVRNGGVEFAGWFYTPHPETKDSHFQPPTMLELILPRMEGVRYGDTVELRLRSTEIAIAEGDGVRR